MCHARLLSKADYLIDWQHSALTIHRRVMGLHPGATTQWQGKRLKLLASEPLITRLRDQLSPDVQGLLERWPSQTQAPGTVLACEPDLGLVVSTTGCPLLIREAQLEGKAPASGTSLLQQLGAHRGDQLGV